MLREGAQLLVDALGGHPFEYREVVSGVGSGGDFVEGRIEAPTRAIEIHFRNTLGLVHYHLRGSSVSHDFYMKHLGVRDRCRYPGYSEDPMEGFRNLAHDIRAFGQDFLGKGDQLVDAARAESEEQAVRGRDLNIGYTGDRRARQDAREAFKAGDYRKTIELLTTLQYPDDLSASEVKLLAMAQKRTRD